MVEEKERKSVIGAGFRVGHLIVAGATYEGTSVTFLESRRKKPSKSNTSRYTGVYQNKRSGLWVAQITFKGKTYYGIVCED